MVVCFLSGAIYAKFYAFLDICRVKYTNICQITYL